MVGVPYVGTYWPQGAVAEAARVGNFVIVSPHQLLAENPQLAADLRAHPSLSLILQFPANLDVLAGRVDWTPELEMWRDALEASDFAHRVIALLCDEELYPRLLGGAFDGDAAAKLLPRDPFARLDIMHGILRRLVRQMQRVFPLYPVGHVTTCWSHRRDWGPGYYAPSVEELDFLGVDPYITGHVTEAAFRREVMPIVEEAGRHGKPVLLVGQAFSDDLRAMPSAEQLGWWTTLAADQGCVGLAWFTLTMPPWMGTGLVDHPDQLAWVRGYAARIGIVEA